MKTVFYFLALMGCLFACSEPETPSPASAFENSPTCAYFAQDLVDGKWISRIYFFDLNHQLTKDKKFFAAEFMYKGRDTMKIALPPQSIDNIAIGFPEDIMDYPGYGWVAQWKNASYVLNRSSGAFFKDFIPTNPASNLYFMNDPQYVGSLAGKWPNAYLSYIRVPNGTGGHTQYTGYFYFKHKKAFIGGNTYSTGDESEVINYGILKLKDIDDIDLGASYEWENVDAAFSSTHSNGSFFPQHYFIDFKNWRYFVWTEGCDSTTGDCLNRTIEFGDYQSLDKLLKWPEGWGKP
jgi:hypothetical protein